MSLESKAQEWATQTETLLEGADFSAGQESLLLHAALVQKFHALSEESYPLTLLRQADGQGQAISFLEAHQEVLEVPAVLSFLASRPDLWGEIFKNSQLVAFLLASKRAMSVIVFSPVIFSSLIAVSSAFKVLLSDETVMGIVSQSEVAVRAIIASPVALKMAARSQVAMEKFAHSDCAVFLLTSFEKALEVLLSEPVAIRYFKDRTEFVSAAIDMQKIQPLLNDTASIRAIINDPELLTKVLKSSSAIETLAQSHIALSELVKSSNRDLLVRENGSFQRVKNIIYETVKAHWRKVRGQKGRNFYGLNSAMTREQGFVFACLGKYDTSGKTSLLHPVLYFPVHDARRQTDL